MRRLKKVSLNIGVFVLVAALVYFVGRTLIGAWPIWSSMMNGGMMGNGMMGNGMMGGSGWLGALLMLLFWGGLVALVAWLLVSLFSRGSRGRSQDEPGGPPDTAEATLRERFARGEISAEEYEETLKLLRSRPPGSVSGDAIASNTEAPISGERREELPVEDEAEPSNNGVRVRKDA
jgi:putative membrane protein